MEMSIPCRTINPLYTGAIYHDICGKAVNAIATLYSNQLVSLFILYLGLVVFPSARTARNTIQPPSVYLDASGNVRRGANPNRPKVAKVADSEMIKQLDFEQLPDSPPKSLLAASTFLAPASVSLSSPAAPAPSASFESMTHSSSKIKLSPLNATTSASSELAALSVPRSQPPQEVYDLILETETCPLMFKDHDGTIFVQEIGTQDPEILGKVRLLPPPSPPTHPPPGFRFYQCFCSGLNL